MPVQPPPVCLCVCAVTHQLPSLWVSKKDCRKGFTTSKSMNNENSRIQYCKSLPKINVVSPFDGQLEHHFRTGRWLCSALSCNRLCVHHAHGAPLPQAAAAAPTPPPACDHDGKLASWEMLSNQKLLLLGRLGMAVCACACLGAACLGVQTADVGARRLPRRCARERRLRGMRAKKCMLLQLELDHFFRFQNNQSNYQTSDTVFDATRIRLSSKFPAK